MKVRRGARANVTAGGGKWGSTFVQGVGWGRRALCETLTGGANKVT